MLGFCDLQSDVCTFNEPSGKCSQVRSEAQVEGKKSCSEKKVVTVMEMAFCLEDLPSRSVEVPSHDVGSGHGKGWKGDARRT